MSQVSRPMQIALAATLVFAVLWFAVLAPGDETEPPMPAPVATTPPVEPGGVPAQTDLGKTIENAKTAADDASSAVQERSDVTGAETPTPPGTGAPTGGDATSAPGTTGGSGGAAKPTGKRQAQADRTIRRIEHHLDEGRAVVFFVGSPDGREDRIVRNRLDHAITRRGGKVRVVKINVKDVSLYDGLLGDLQVVQTPSTVVIAPDRQAKVLGGLVSTERIDRLTSSALLSAENATS